MKEIIYSKNAPNPLGPYNQAVKIADVLYTAGQIPVDPKTNELVAGGIEEQTEQVMKNLEAVLIAANTSFKQMIKTTVFLTDLNDFSTFNKIYGRFFDEAAAPARSTVEVTALPKGALVEIEGIAIV
jgi:2-iminobutanoate/2-iminopropanoate deaminase